MGTMETIRPTDKHQKLKALEGTWVGEEKIHPTPFDPKGGAARGRTESRVDLDGFYLVSDYVQERDGKTCYKGHGILGYDPKTNSYTMNWFDTMGFPAGEPAKGAWEGNRLSFQKVGPMGHGRYTYELLGEGKYNFTLEHSPDGKSWSKFMEGTYTKK